MRDQYLKRMALKFWSKTSHKAQEAAHLISDQEMKEETLSQCRISKAETPFVSNEFLETDSD